MEVIKVWLLVLVINGDLVEDETYANRAECMFAGTALAAQAVWLVPQEVGERLNPFTPRKQIPIDGFFCETPRPEKVTQVTPVCLAPTRECS